MDGGDSGVQGSSARVIPGPIPALLQLHAYHAYNHDYHDYYHDYNHDYHAYNLDYEGVFLAFCRAAFCTAAE